MPKRRPSTETTGPRIAPRNPPLCMIWRFLVRDVFFRASWRTFCFFWRRERNWDSVNGMLPCSKFATHSHMHSTHCLSQCVLRRWLRMLGEDLCNSLMSGAWCLNRSDMLTHCSQTLEWSQESMFYPFISAGCRQSYLRLERCHSSVSFSPRCPLWDRQPGRSTV